MNERSWPPAGGRRRCFRLRPSPSSSSLAGLLVSRSISEEAVSMKAKPMNRVVFWGNGPWVSAASPDGAGRSVPLPEVLHTPTR